MLMINSLSQYFGHKYKANLGKNKQKIPKSYFFSKKKCVLRRFCAKRQIFFVILRRKGTYGTASALCVN